MIADKIKNARTILYYITIIIVGIIPHLRSQGH